MKRSTPALKLNNSPIVLALTQVGISPVLQMEDFIPRIQEKLRHIGYPLFQKVQTQELVLGPKIQVGSSTRWLFIDKDSTEATVVTQNFIALETNKYATFEDFTDKVSKVLKIIGEIVGVALVKRIGLRYVNLIRINEGEALKEYLKPGLLGLDLNEVGMKTSLYRFESRGETESGKMRIRLFQTHGNLFLPPDINANELKYNKELLTGRPGAILDVDHFSEDQREFSPDELVSVLWKLHDYSGRAFRSSVTETALQRWR